MTFVPTCGIVLAIIAAGSSPSAESEPAVTAEVDLELRFPTALVQAAETSPDQPPPPAGPPRKPAFGTKDTWRWHIGGGYGRELESTYDEFGLIGGGVSYFVIEDLSLVMELNGLYFSQETESGFPPSHDAWGFNFNLLARWHFLARERWSIYGDGGVGVMYTTEPVPGPDAGDSRGGGRFSFTPQIGFGASFEVADNTRLLVGARLHHISNAQSASNNPPRNSLYFYIAASFPF
jgi:hypothetical protein